MGPSGYQPTHNRSEQVYGTLSRTDTAPSSYFTTKLDQPTITSSVAGYQPYPSIHPSFTWHDAVSGNPFSAPYYPSTSAPDFVSMSSSGPTSSKWQPSHETTRPTSALPGTHNPASNRFQQPSIFRKPSYPDNPPRNRTLERDRILERDRTLERVREPRQESSTDRDLAPRQSDSAPSLGTFQPFRVHRPRRSGPKAPDYAVCTAMLDACAFGPDNNSVAAYFLRGEFDLDLGEGEVITLRISATDHGPVQKGFEDNETFTVKHRGHIPLLLGRDWIEKRWDDCTFFTMKANLKKKSVQSPADLAELQRRDELRQQLTSQRNASSTAESSSGSTTSASTTPNNSNNQPTRQRGYSIYSRREL